MIEIKVHQYLASPDDQESLDDLIALLTAPLNSGTPPHSHSEVELPRDVTGTLFRKQPTMLFSATLRGNSTGTRFAFPRNILKNKDRWDSYGKQFTEAEAAEMMYRALSIDGRPYFKIGIVLDFCTPFGILGAWLGRKLDQWYCSMAVYYVLTGIRKRISPRRLTRWMLKNGWVKL